MKKYIGQICSVCLILCIVLGICTIGNSGVCAASSEDEYKYKEYVMDYYKQQGQKKDFWEYYDELYEHYSDPDSKDATPDFVAVLCSYYKEFSTGFCIIGEYRMTNGCHWPYEPGIHIVTLDDGKVYTLTEAVRADIDGVDEMLEKWCTEGIRDISVKRFRDMDGDNKITVKEATAVQKHIAGLKSIPNNKFRLWHWTDCPKGMFYEGGFYYVYIGDFNYDGVTNIRDATTVQKRVAGLED